MKHRWELIPATLKVLSPLASMITGTTATRTRQHLPTTGQEIVTQYWESLARESLRANQHPLQQANLQGLDGRHQIARLGTWIHTSARLPRLQSTLKLTTVRVNWKTDPLLSSLQLMTPSFITMKSVNLVKKKKASRTIGTKERTQE